MEPTPMHEVVPDSTTVSVAASASASIAQNDGDNETSQSITSLPTELPPQASFTELASSAFTKTDDHSMNVDNTTLDPTLNATMPAALPTSPTSSTLPADIAHLLQLNIIPTEAELEERNQDYSEKVRKLREEVLLSKKLDKTGEEEEGELKKVEDEMAVGGVERVDLEKQQDSSDDSSSDEADEDDDSSSNSDSSAVVASSLRQGATSTSTSTGANSRRRPNRKRAGSIEEDDDLSEDDVNSKSMRGPKTEHEVDEDTLIPSTSNLMETLDAEVEIVRFGQVEKLIENVVTIKADTTGSYRVLDEGTICCWEDRKVAGTVFDTFGSVQQPYYSLRFPTSSPPSREIFTPSRPMYYAPKLATFIFTRELQAIKGSDASNVYDEEVGAGEIEFSDDEAEQEYKRAMKNERKNSRAPSKGPGPSKAAGANVRKPIELPNRPVDPMVEDEDDEEIGYNVLQRPKGLHLMGERPPSGPEGRKMFERDTGRTVEGEKEFEFSDDEGIEQGDDLEMSRQGGDSTLARSRGRGRGRGRGEQRGRGRGGDRGRGGSRGGGRGGGGHTRGHFGQQNQYPQGDRRAVAPLPQRPSASLPSRPQTDFSSTTPYDQPNSSFPSPQFGYPIPPSPFQFGLPQSPLPQGIDSTQGIYNPNFRPNHFPPSAPYSSFPNFAFAHPQSPMMAPPPNPTNLGNNGGHYNPRFFPHIAGQGMSLQAPQGGYYGYVPPNQPGSGGGGQGQQAPGQGQGPGGEGWNPQR